MRLTDRRLLRQLPRPGLAGQLLPARGRRRATGRTWRVLLDLGNGALGALHKYVDPLTIDAVLVSHLHADHCLDLCGYYVLRKYHPDRRAAADPGLGSGRHRRPDGARLRPARRPGDDRGVRLPGVGRAGRHRAVHGDAGAGRRTRCRPSACGSAPTARPSATPATPARAPPSTTSPATPTCFLAEASFLATRRQPARPAPDRRRRAARSRPGPGAKRLVLTHIPPWHDPEVALAEARTTYDGPCRWRGAGATTSSEQLPGEPTRSGHAAGSGARAPGSMNRDHRGPDGLRGETSCPSTSAAAPGCGYPPCGSRRRSS